MLQVLFVRKVGGHASRCRGRGDSLGEGRSSKRTRAHSSIRRRQTAGGGGQAVSLRVPTHEVEGIVQGARNKILSNGLQRRLKLALPWNVHLQPQLLLSVPQARR